MQKGASQTNKHLVLVAIVPSVMVITWQRIMDINLTKKENTGKDTRGPTPGLSKLTGRPLISDPCNRSRALSAARRSN